MRPGDVSGADGGGRDDPADAAAGLSGAAPRRALAVDAGIATATGRRPANEDFAACWLGEPGAIGGPRKGVVAAIADGVGGARGGRVAAETIVRSVIDALLDQSEALPVRRSGAAALAAVNRWVHAMGKADPELAGMAATLTAVVLRGRRLHVLHVGDTRLYRLRQDELELLTTDHVLGRPGVSHGLTRAVGAEEALRVDYAEHAARENDRLLLVSDGVHGALPAARIAAALRLRESAAATARRLVEAAAASSAGDNATALVLDVLDLPAADRVDLEGVIEAAPILPPPRAGAVVDGYRLEQMLADTRYSRVFRAQEEASGRAVVLKFPKPGAAEAAVFRAAYLRENWIAARVRSPYLGETIETPAAGQSSGATQLYMVMPFYGAETLERRLLRAPPLRLEEGVAIGVALCKAVIALHRAGVIHRDIKPDNVVLSASGPVLVDLGVALLPHLEDLPEAERPGTPSYMAPELLDGAAADEATDLYALGVTLWRAWSGGAYPHGEVEPFSRPRFGRPAALARRRPDLPSWLDTVLARAVAAERRERQGDVLELMLALETGLVTAAPAAPRPRSAYERDPLRFWQCVAAALALALLATQALR